LLRSVGDSGTNLVKKPGSTLSDRELEVFRLIGQGKKTQDIATRLHLSAKTVETYRARIRQKLGVTDAADLLCQAERWVLEERAVGAFPQ